MKLIISPVLSAASAFGNNHGSGAPDVIQTLTNMPCAPNSNKLSAISHEEKVETLHCNVCTTGSAVLGFEASLCVSQVDKLANRIVCSAYQGNSA